MTWTELASRLPRRSLHLVTRAAAVLRAHLALRGAQLGANVGATGPITTDLRGRCTVGPRVTFRGGMIPTHLRVHPGATLAIGADTIFNYGVSLEAHRSVSIGAGCMIASMVRICDLEGDVPRPVVIGDHVWIAHGAIVCAGVTLGDGAVVSAGSVVTSDVPPGHLASGNPARVVPVSLVADRSPPTPTDRSA